MRSRTSKIDHKEAHKISHKEAQKAQMNKIRKVGILKIRNKRFFCAFCAFLWLTSLVLFVAA
jgi:hypothetical protein